MDCPSIKYQVVNDETGKWFTVSIVAKGWDVKRFKSRSIRRVHGWTEAVTDEWREENGG